jgi:nickel superoxide dismutase
MTKTAFFDRMFAIPEAQAHCDIPCGIYDPSGALIAALSVVRMMDIIAENAEKEMNAGTLNSIARCVAIKETEAAKVKDEVRIIWGDYFKAPHIEKHPGVHALVHGIMMAAGKCKQGVSRADGEALVAMVNEFAEMFWDTKSVKTEMKVAPYAPKMEVVTPVL